MTTCVTRLDCFVRPEGKCYYHKHVIEEVVGRKLDNESNLESIRKWAVTWAAAQVAAGKDWRGKVVKFASDARLFSCLSAEEREYLIDPEDFHVAVISARRANEIAAIRAIVNVQSQLVASGAEPVWYVDAASLKDYLALGLKAEVGGKLVPSRNKALNRAKRLGRPCMQVSDDISRWDYMKGHDRSVGDLWAGNEAAKHAQRLRISPMAAARFILAKMRRPSQGQDLEVYFLWAMLAWPSSRTHSPKTTSSWAIFCAGRRLAVSFRCSVHAEGGLRLHVHSLGEARGSAALQQDVHRGHPREQRGGARSERDSTGEKERANIKILQNKWPGVFSLNGKRGDGSTQVSMAWRRRLT